MQPYNYNIDHPKIDILGTIQGMQQIKANKQQSALNKMAMEDRERTLKSNLAQQAEDNQLKSVLSEGYSLYGNNINKVFQHASQKAPNLTYKFVDLFNKAKEQQLGIQSKEFGMQKDQVGINTEKQKAFSTYGIPVTKQFNTLSEGDKLDAFPEFLNTLGQMKLDIPPEWVESGYTPEIGQRLNSMASMQEMPKAETSPSSVQEYNFFKSLNEDEKKEYLTVKRSQQIMNMGGYQGVLDPLTNQITDKFTVTPKTTETPEYKGQVAGAVETATTGAKKQSGDAIYKGPQYLAATFGIRMQEANDNIDKLEKSGFDRTSAITSAQASLPTQTKSGKLKQQEQAERNFLNAVLRRESGAAIAPTEFENGSQQYFPRFGDDKATLEQKRINRNTAIAGLKAEAGGAWVAVKKETTGKPKITVKDVDFMSEQEIDKQLKELGEKK